MTTPAATERERLARRWGNLISTYEAKDAAVAQPGANVLPLTPEGGGKITVVNKSQGSPASRRRRSPVVLCSFLIVVALPVVLAGVYLFFVAADQYVA